MANPLANLGHYAHPPKTVKIVKKAQVTSAPSGAVRPMPSMNEMPKPAFRPLAPAPPAPPKRTGMQIPLQRGEDSAYDMADDRAQAKKKGKTVKIIEKMDAMRDRRMK